MKTVLVSIKTCLVNICPDLIFKKHSCCTFVASSPDSLQFAQKQLQIAELPEVWDFDVRETM